jgi:hypothetical protein
VRELLYTKQITVLKRPVCSTNIAPNDFFFPRVKEIFEGRYFDNIDDIRTNTTAALKANAKQKFQI